MKLLRYLSLILVLILTVTGVCGCMEKTDNNLINDFLSNDTSNIKDELLNYAAEKYGQNFTVVYFQEAKDATYTNILTLSDGECNFNVYQSEGYDASDDYPQMLADKKIYDYFKNKINTNDEVYTYFMLKDDDNMDIDYVEQSDVTTILDDYSMLKIIIVVKTINNISDNAKELFDIYKEAMSFNPKYIDYQVIQIDNSCDELDMMLNNIPAFYDNEWDKYSEIESYLSVKDTEIESPSALIKGVE